MNLKDIVCDFEYAKRLKELGVKQESLFYYHNNPYNEDRKIIGDKVESYECISAFASDELLEIVPEKLESSPDIFLNLLIYKTKEGFVTGYFNLDNRKEIMYRCFS